MIRQKEGYVLRNIMGEYMLFPTGTEMQQFKGTILLNELSVFIWNKLQTPVKFEDLMFAIIKEYDVEEEQLKKDLTEIINTFSKYGIIENISCECDK